MNLAKMTRFTRLVKKKGLTDRQFSESLGKDKAYFGSLMNRKAGLDILLPVAKKLGKDEKFCYYYTREELEKKPRQILIDLAKKMYRGELK
jgi:transcriptional regulator with XRE-family HTH domain